MFLRSVKDDHGFHIHKEELMEDDNEKGVKA
jgi:cytochrome c oxidase subunit 1